MLCFSNPKKMNQRKLEIKIANNKQRTKQRPESRQFYHQEKSLKDLILSKPKHSMIQKIQSQLSALHGVRVIDRTIFYLAWYINHYQSLYQLINNGLLNINASFHRFKNYSIKGPNQRPPLDNKPKLFKPKTTILTERISQKKQIKVVMDSYKFKCLKQFFSIDSYGEESIIKTVVQKLHEKIKREQIRTIDSRVPSLRKISIIQHGRQPSDMNKLKENNNVRKQNLNVGGLLPKIANFQLVETSSAMDNKIELKKRVKKVQCIDVHEQRKRTPILKSFKNENRRNGIHDLNKILVQIEELKEILWQSSNHGDEVMNRASSLKARLNSLLSNLIVRPIANNRQIKAKDINININKLR